jgi:hypothetical protein
MHKNVNINNKMLFGVLKGDKCSHHCRKKKSINPLTRVMIFFLQCWLHVSPFKTPKKAFYYLIVIFVRNLLSTA